MSDTTQLEQHSFTPAADSAARQLVVRVNVGARDSPSIPIAVAVVSTTDKHLREIDRTRARAADRDIAGDTATETSMHASKRV